MANTRVAPLMVTSLALLFLMGTEASVARSELHASHSSVASSHVLEADGSTKGVCSYVNAEGRNIKISYRQFPSGKIEAEADPYIENPLEALEKCRGVAKTTSRNAQESVLKTQENIFKMNQDIQERIFRQNQAIQQSFQHPRFFQFPQYFPQHFPFVR